MHRAHALVDQRGDRAGPGDVRAHGLQPGGERVRQGVVDQIVARFNAAEALAVVITPGGTRTYTDHWKSGFYWIAYKAQVPLLCAYINYAERRVFMGLSFTPTGNLREDMDRIRSFFVEGKGLYPQQAADIRLRDEAEPGELTER